MWRSSSSTPSGSQSSTASTAGSRRQPTCSPFRSTAPSRSLVAGASSGTSSSVPSTRPTCARRSSTGCCIWLGMDHETDEGEMLALQRRAARSGAAGDAQRLRGPGGQAQRGQVDARQPRRRREGRDRLRPTPDDPARDPRRAFERRAPDRPCRPAGRAASAGRAHRAHGQARAAGARGLRRRSADPQRRAGRRPRRPLHRAGAREREDTGDDRGEQGRSAVARGDRGGAAGRPPSSRWATRCSRSRRAPGRAWRRSSSTCSR